MCLCAFLSGTCVCVPLRVFLYVCVCVCVCTRVVSRSRPQGGSYTHTHVGAHVRARAHRPTETLRFRARNRRRRRRSVRVRPDIRAHRVCACVSRSPRVFAISSSTPPLPERQRPSACARISWSSDFTVHENRVRTHAPIHKLAYRSIFFFFCIIIHCGKNLK